MKLQICRSRFSFETVGTVVLFCEHYGTIILPTKPAMPRHKGKIEAGQ